MYVHSIVSFIHSPSRAVAMYFIDKLALRAGNEKDSDESADTVGCCSLRVEHISMCIYYLVTLSINACLLLCRSACNI